MRWLFVGVLALAQAASVAWTAGFSCQALTPPPGEVVHALVVGSELVVADHSAPALWRYQRSTGKQVAKVGKVGKRRGEYERPFYLFPTENGYGVFDGGRYAWLFFGHDHRFLSETALDPEAMAEFFVEAPPAWENGTFVAYGGISGALSGGADGLLFRFRQGKFKTLVPVEKPEDLLRLSDAQEGGVCRLDNGRFVAVSPVEYRFFVIDGRGELVGSFAGRRQLFHSPDWRSRPKDPYDRDAYFSWLARQAYVSAPHCLTGGKVAVMVRSPARSGVFLETYRVPDGLFLGTQEVNVPLHAGKYLISVTGTPGGFFFLVRDSYVAGSPARLCEISLP